MALPWWRKLKSGQAVFAVVFLGLIFARPAAAEWTDVVATGLAQLICWATSGVGKVIVLMIGGVLMPVAQYNEFVTSPVIGAGWAVVRDAVNMFFVIIFILIAFGTILGIEKFKWRQQVPRLLLVAIFINFSRMLCGVMIDFSQVFMLTFINAVKDIAGGNFIQMFGLQKIMDAKVLSGDPIDIPTTLIAAGCGLIMMLIVLVTVFFMTIAFLYRIVLLWGLVTLAPLAWFFKSTEGILKVGGKNPYSEWWTKFSCALMLGPILAFFLWLALAVAGSGAEMSGFDVSGAPEASLLNKALDPGNLITFIVGISLLIMGLDAANDACASAGGTMSKLMGSASKASKAIAGAPAAVAGTLGLAGARYGLEKGKDLAKWTGRQTLGRGTDWVKNKATDAAGFLADSGRGPKFLRGMAKGIQKKGLAGRAAAAEAMAGKDVSTDDMLFALEGENGLSLNADKKQKQLAFAKRLLSDPRVMKDPKKFAQLQEFLGKTDSSGSTVLSQVQKTFKGDVGFQDQIKDIESTAPSLFGKDKIVKTLDSTLPPEEQQERIKKLADSQYGNQDISDHLKNMRVHQRDANGKVKKDLVTGEELTMSAFDALQNGGGGFSNDQREAFKKGQEALAKANALIPPKSESDQIAETILGGDSSKLEALRKRTDFDPNAIMSAGLSGKNAKQRALFRQSLVNSGLFKTKIPPASVDESEIEALAIQEQKNEGKHNGVTGTESPEELNNRLARIRQKMIDDNSTESSGTLKAFGFKKDGQFENEEAKKDFSTAIKKNPRLIIQTFKNANQEGYKNRDLIATITPEVISGLFRQYRSSSGEKQKEIGAEITFLFKETGNSGLRNESINWTKQFDLIKEKIEEAAAPPPSSGSDRILEEKIRNIEDEIRQYQKKLSSGSFEGQSLDEIRKELADLIENKKVLKSEKFWAPIANIPGRY